MLVNAPHILQTEFIIPSYSWWIVFSILRALNSMIFLPVIKYGQIIFYFIPGGQNRLPVIHPKGLRGGLYIMTASLTTQGWQ
jgi:hypothetical protein